MSSRNFKLRLDNFYYDTIFSSVDTFRHWQRWGAKEFYRDVECVYYKLDI